MILQVLRVRGGSLAPRFQDGDYVLISALPLLLRGPRPADVLVFDHPDYGRLIKRLERIENGGLFMLGEDIDSVDSRRFGLVQPGALRGKVILHVSGKKSTSKR